MGKEQSAEVLVKRFIEGVVKHREYMCTDHPSANRHFEKFMGALKELFLLEERGIDALVRLLDDPRPLIRVTAAIYLIRLFPEKCKKVLEREVEQRSAMLPEAFVTLKRWERRSYICPFRGEATVPPKN